MAQATKTRTVADCMTADPMTVGPKDSLQRVVELLRRRDIRSVPVLEDGRLIGIVTDRDVRQVAPAYPVRVSEAIKRLAGEVDDQQLDSRDRQSAHRLFLREPAKVA